MLGFLAVFAALYGVSYWLIRERKVPVLLMRVWFTMHLLLALLMLNAGCHIISFFAYTLHLIPVATAQAMSRLLKAIIFKYGFANVIPHVRTVVMPGSLPLSTLGGGAVCACHCSFLDSLFFMFIAPLSFLWRGKTFLKSSLLNLPIFGYALQCTGYFPVYFANESSASFHVNKEKQAAVGAEVEAWLSKGNHMCFFPEGVMNPNPEVLTDFRLGTFNNIIKHKMPLRYFVFYGDHEVWPPSWKGLPGFPADIYLYVGTYPYDPTKEDAVSLSTGLRDEMQRHLDDMLALREDRGYEPWCAALKKEK